MDKNWRTHPALRILADLLVLGALAGLGLFLYGLTFQMMVAGGMLAADADGEGYGLILTNQAIMVWSAAILIGIAALFIRANWRWPLLAAPAYAPSLYAVMMVLAG